MIVFLLLVIIAILLLGSAVVLRGIGLVLGGIATVAALAVGISIAQQIPVWVWWSLGLTVASAIALVFILHARQQAQLARRITEIRAQGAARLAEIKAAGTQRSEVPLGTPGSSFHATRLSKEQRKAMRGRSYSTPRASEGHERLLD